MSETLKQLITEKDLLENFEFFQDQIQEFEKENILTPKFTWENERSEEDCFVIEPTFVYQVHASL